MEYLHNTIKQVAIILDLELNSSSPIIYEYTIATYDEDTLVSTVKQ